MGTEPSSIDTLWVLTCACFVMLMQVGFCCLESGLVRSKNSIHVAIKNLVDFCLAALCFWFIGFSLLFGDGEDGELLALNGNLEPRTLTLFFFQLMFCGTATTLVSGAVAERLRFSAYIVIAVLISALIYPMCGQWIWGGVLTGEPTGWLEKRGFVDFAGSTVVHSVGAWVALAAVLVIGPRVGRFEDDKRRAIPASNLSSAAIGALLLWIGWLGFNGGSRLHLSENVPLILVNTTLAGASGGIVALTVARVRFGHFGVVSLINGALAGLVSITASCHAVSPASAVVIAAVGSLLAFYGRVLLETRKIDDVIGAISVHGFAGVWGTLAVGLLASPSQLGTGLSRFEQIQIQALGCAAVFVCVFSAGYLLLRLIDAVFPLRVTCEEEDLGLNVSEHDAVTESFQLLTEMEEQRLSGDFTRRVDVEPHTEIGVIATEYNRVLDRINAEHELIAAANDEIHEINTRLTAAHAEAIASEKEMRETAERLNKFNQLAVGRELRMVTLKREVNEALEQGGREARYPLPGEVTDA